MSFMLTTEQVRRRTKTVTRRRGWLFLKPGELVRAVAKCQGLKKGERMQPLAVIRIVDVRQEPLNRLLTDIDYGFEECRREGFGDDPRLRWPSAFVSFFCESHRPCEPQFTVTRIEFEYVEQPDRAEPVDSEPIHTWKSSTMRSTGGQARVGATAWSYANNASALIAKKASASWAGAVWSRIRSVITSAVVAASRPVLRRRSRKCRSSAA